MGSIGARKGTTMAATVAQPVEQRLEEPAVTAPTGRSTPMVEVDMQAMQDDLQRDLRRYMPEATITNLEHNADEDPFPDRWNVTVTYTWNGREHKTVYDIDPQDYVRR